MFSSQFYHCSSGIPEFADIPSNGAGVREYCHNSYNGCFSKVEVHDFQSFLGYVLTDGYNLDVGIVSFG